LKRLAKEGMIVGASQILGVIGRFATVWWLTRVLDPRSFCDLALIQGVAALGFGVLCGALLQAGLRFESEALNDRTTGALRATLKPFVMRAAWMTVLILIASAFVWKTATGSPVSMLAVIAGIALIVPDAFRFYEVNALNAARRQSEYAIWNTADAIARPAGAVLAMSLLGRSPQAALAGFCVAAVAVNVVCARLFAVDADLARAAVPSDEVRSRIVRFAAPLVPFALMAWIVGLADRYALAATAGKGVAGVYAAVYGVGSQGFLALGVFGLTIFRPLYFAAVDAGDLVRGRRVLGAWLATLAGGSLAGVAALVLLGRPIARICLGPEFQAGAPLLPWIGAAYALQSLQTMFEVLLYAKHKTAPLLLVQIAGAVTAVVLYAVLIPRYGGFGAALATMGSFAMSCVVAARLGDVLGALRAGQPGAAAR
jgi:O-antigen/teichoic acid export membrane protein